MKALCNVSHRGLQSLAYLENVCRGFQKTPGSLLSMRNNTFAQCRGTWRLPGVPVWEVCGCSMSNAQSGPEVQLAWACKAGRCCTLP